MDITDHATEREQEQRDEAIKHSLNSDVHKDGPEDCMKCGEINNRRKQGFAVCSDCVGQL